VFGEGFARFFFTDFGVIVYLWGNVIGTHAVKDHEFDKTVFGLFGPLADEHANLGAGCGRFQALAQNTWHGRGLAGRGGRQSDRGTDLFLGR